MPRRGAEERDRDSDYGLAVTFYTNPRMHQHMKEIVKELKKTLPSMSLSYLYRQGGLQLANSLLKACQKAKETRPEVVQTQ